MKPKLSGRQKKALEKSIKKWKAIVQGLGVDKGVLDCELCRKYLSIHACSQKCPVKMRVGTYGCRSTPYMKWASHQHIKHNQYIHPYYIRCPVCKKLATKELNFLKSLRGR